MAQGNGLPAAWQEAFRRDAQPGRVRLADPAPERRLARLLAAWIAAGLFFLVFPGTLVGVWNLITISSRESGTSVPAPWVQAHGHAQLLGWVGAFIIGISLYMLPKLRGGRLRSPAAGWLMWALWSGAIALRWSTGIFEAGWQWAWPAAAGMELLVALLLIWQTWPPGAPARFQLRDWLIEAGFLGLLLTMLVQAQAVWPPPQAPVVPAGINNRMLHLAVWAFCYPVVWGYSAHFLPTLLGLGKPSARLACIALGLLAAGLPFPWLLPASVLAACWSLRIFHPSQRPAKVAGTDPRYPWFVRLSFVWLAVSALLGALSESPGIAGASRHAFTVGFLAGMIFSIGPRILPAFLSSRELWSARLVGVSLALLTAGCALRVGFEPLAYAGVLPSAWAVLPVSAILELAAVLLFALNIAKTLATPLPAWFFQENVKDTMTLYWYVMSYPPTRKLLIRAGLKSLERARRIPQSLTLREAAEAEGVEVQALLEPLRRFFVRRQARALRSTTAKRAGP
ncbi:MAG: NnrS family protein [Bryobacterales bacterium]|nr:NnrS family protein [Bryobacterales bacterium]